LKTSIILYYSDSSYFQNSINDVFSGRNKWFKASERILNFDKTEFMKFTTKPSINFNIGYGNKTTGEVFLGLYIDNNVNFAMRTATPLLNVDTLKLVYFAYLNSIMSCGVILWVNSADSRRVLVIQKKIIRIMAGVKRRVSCRKLCRKFNICPLVSKFLLSSLSVIVDDMEKFQTKYDIHSRLLLQQATSSMLC
jgi:hypothetical protein